MLPHEAFEHDGHGARVEVELHGELRPDPRRPREPAVAEHAPKRKGFQSGPVARNERPARPLE
jgi:hypothetical protein